MIFTVYFVEREVSFQSNSNETLKIVSYQNTMKNSLLTRDLHPVMDRNLWLTQNFIWTVIPRIFLISPNPDQNRMMGMGLKWWNKYMLGDWVWLSITYFCLLWVIGWGQWLKQRVCCVWNRIHKTGASTTRLLQISHFVWVKGRRQGSLVIRIYDHFKKPQYNGWESIATVRIPSSKIPSSILYPV